RSPTSRRVWMDSLRANRSNGSCSRRSTKPSEHGGFDFCELHRIQRAEFANGASDRIGGDALCDERALFQEGNLYVDFKLRTAKRRRVKDNSSQGMICIGERNAENESRPNFRNHPALSRQSLSDGGSRTTRLRRA